MMANARNGGRRKGGGGGEREKKRTSGNNVVNNFGLTLHITQQILCIFIERYDMVHIFFTLKLSF